jgi:hypothetical protein
MVDKNCWFSILLISRSTLIAHSWAFFQTIQHEILHKIGFDLINVFYSIFWIQYNWAWHHVQFSKSVLFSVLFGKQFYSYIIMAFLWHVFNAFLESVFCAEFHGEPFGKKLNCEQWELTGISTKYWHQQFLSTIHYFSESEKGYFFLLKSMTILQRNV